MSLYLDGGSPGSLQGEVIRAALDRDGVVLLREQGYAGAGFLQLTEALCDVFHTVGARTSAAASAADSYTMAVPAGNYALLGHAESSFRPCAFIPDVCFFMCQVPPSVSGGETTFVDGVRLLQLLPDALRRRLQEQGVLYEFSWDAARWQAEFGVADESALRAFLDAFPHSHYRLEQGMLHMRHAAPAISRTRDGQAAFANGILAHLPAITHPRHAARPVHVKPSNRVYFGDGEPLSNDIINLMIDAHDQLVQRHRWQAGDILIIDNRRFMHGREASAAPCERRIISRFGRLKARRGA